MLIISRRVRRVEAWTNLFVVFSRRKETKKTEKTTTTNLQAKLYEYVRVFHSLAIQMHFYLRPRLRSIEICCFCFVVLFSSFLSVKLRYCGLSARGIIGIPWHYYAIAIWSIAARPASMSSWRHGTTGQVGLVCCVRVYSTRLLEGWRFKIRASRAISLSSS